MVTTATLEQLQRTDDPAGLLTLLRLQLGTELAYLVDDTRNWDIGGTTYTGLPFRFTLPEQQAGQAPRATLEVDNVGLVLGQLVDALPPGATVMMTVRVVSRARPTVVDLELTAPLSAVRINMHKLQATVGNDDALRAPAVMARYDPTTCPGLFAG